MKKGKLVLMCLLCVSLFVASGCGGMEGSLDVTDPTQLSLILLAAIGGSLIGGFIAILIATWFF